MKRNRNIGSILLIAAGLLLIAAALYELIPALLAYKPGGRYLRGAARGLCDRTAGGIFG